MIPQNTNEAEILQRLQKIEQRIFRGKTFEENYGETSESQKGEPTRPAQ